MIAFILSIQTEASLLVLAKSIHYCYSGEVESGGCLGENGRGGGYWRRERIEQQEKREKWGILRKNGQYFVIEKKDKGKEGQEKREREQGMGGGVHPPPPPSAAPTPSPVTVKCSSLVSKLVPNLIRLDIYHITEVYCPNDSFPVVPLISCLGENFTISTENI